MSSKPGLVIVLLLSLAAACSAPPQGDAELYTPAADAVVEDWSDELSGTFREMALLPEAEFIPAWQAEHDRWLTQLQALPGYAPDLETAALYEARLFYEWALGRLYYPRFHGALTRNRAFEPSASYNDYLAEVDLSRGDLLELDEYTSFIVAKRDGDSLAITEARGAELNNGTRNLTSKRLAHKAFPEGPVRCFLEREALQDWLENYAADGLTTEPDEIAAACPGPETEALLVQVAAELAEREGHEIRVFKTVDGNELELHIYQPEDQTEAAPAMVWLHGGGWYTGSWSWCGACRWFKERGMVVAQVEYRIVGRHGSTIGDSYQDALDAVAWLRTHADEFGIDASRVAASGFSAGGHLAASAGTFVNEGPSRPDAVVSMSGCFDLTNDSYTIRHAGSMDAAKALSPRFAPNPSGPPMFMANAENDDVCSFEEASAFASGAQDVGADITFLPQDGGGHFFLRDAARAEETKAAVNAFLDAKGF